MGSERLDGPRKTHPLRKSAKKGGAPSQQCRDMTRGCMVSYSSFTRAGPTRYTSCSAFMITQKLPLFFLVVALSFTSANASDKPKLTLDEFFNFISYDGVKLSP